MTKTVVLWKQDLFIIAFLIDENCIDAVISLVEDPLRSTLGQQNCLRMPKYSKLRTCLNRSSELGQNDV